MPVGGGFAFEALIACRSVQVAPQVEPSVSAVDVTVKVIAVAAPGRNAGTVGARLPVIFGSAWAVKLAANITAEVDTRATTNVIWSAETRVELFSFFLIFLRPANSFDTAKILPKT
jgi:hypothetical protein